MLSVGRLRWLYFTHRLEKEAGLCTHWLEKSGISAVMIASIAVAPIHVWIPNQPQAISARAIAAKLAPRVPNIERTNTGNGMP